MANIKSVLACIGVDTNTDISILRRMFGFRRNRVPADPDSSITSSVSLLAKVRDFQGRHVNLNVIRVGFDVIADEDEAREKLDYAILRSHTIFRDGDLGIGRVEHYHIDAADAEGADDLGSPSEADELSDDWTVDNDGIDVFVVRNISDDEFVGRSPVPGSCDKGDKDDGLVGGEIGRNHLGVARTFSHEIGHFLGLEHNHGENCPTSASALLNLMAQTRCASSLRDSVEITDSQSGTIRGHCSTMDNC